MNSARPVWLEDEPEIKGWLHEVLDRLDAQPGEERAVPLRFPITERRFPSLFHHGPEADARWELIKSLTTSLPLMVVLQRKRALFSPEYEGARLDVVVEAEATIRSWLERPRVDSELASWQAAVDGAGADWSAEARERLRQRAVVIPGRTPLEVVTALLRVGELRREGLTVRQMSAQAFFGDSKFLEGREPLLQLLYPDLISTPRPLLVSVTLPSSLQGVLFIENHDSYVRAAGGAYPEMEGLALVYAAGFTSGAARIRERNGVALHYSKCDASSSHFEHWWVREKSCDWPVYFWGDLDFEGMRILKALREQFGAEAWKPGYERLLGLLCEGRGHAPEAADKANQKPPGTTGCAYADQVLVPVLMDTRRFVDQEAW